MKHTVATWNPGIGRPGNSKSKGDTAAGVMSGQTIELLEPGADVHARLIDGWTPLHVAAWVGSQEAFGRYWNAARMRVPSPTKTPLPSSNLYRA